MTFNIKTSMIFFGFLQLSHLGLNINIKKKHFLFLKNGIQRFAIVGNSFTKLSLRKGFHPYIIKDMNQLATTLPSCGQLICPPLIFHKEKLN